MPSEQFSFSVFIKNSTGENVEKTSVNLVGVIYQKERRLIELCFKSPDDKVHSFIDGDAEIMEQLAHEIISAIENG